MADEVTMTVDSTVNKETIRRSLRNLVDYYCDGEKDSDGEAVQDALTPERIAELQARFGLPEDSNVGEPPRVAVFRHFLVWLAATYLDQGVEFTDTPTIAL